VDSHTDPRVEPQRLQAVARYGVGQALAFVARRREADVVGIVFAGRQFDPLLEKLPALLIEGLNDGEARLLLESLQLALRKLRP
jgi:hypothetical protein